MSTIVNLKGDSNSEKIDTFIKLIFGSVFYLIGIVGGIYIGGLYICVSIIFVWTWFNLILSAVFITRQIYLLEDYQLKVDFIFHSSSYPLSDFNLIEFKWMGFYMENQIMLHFKNKTVFRKAISIRLNNDKKKILKFINEIYRKGIKVKLGEIGKEMIYYDRFTKTFYAKD